MRSARAMIVLAAMAIAPLAANAQPPGGGGKHHQSADKTQKPKAADDKAYAAALKGIPNKPSDPWHGVR